MPETLNYDTAAATLYENVFAPAYFAKLAEYGITPANEQEALGYLGLADKLRHEVEAEQAKAASTRSSLLERANQYLDKQYGSQPGYDASIRKQAAQLAAHPVMRDAALLYQDGINQILAKQ